MKKFIIVLLMFAILAGCVFAVGETHTITVHASVKEVLPAFRLQAASSETTTSVATNNITPNVVDLVSGAYVAEFDSNISLDEGGTVTITPQLVNSAKTNRGYVLSFTGGTFNVKRNKVDGTHAPLSVTTTAGPIFTGVKSIVADDAAETLTVTFSGATAVGYSVTNPASFGSVTFVYEADTTIDPNEAGERYSTTIIMTITSLS